MVLNPISIGKNILGVVEGVATQDVVKTVSSSVKLAKSSMAPLVDFVPGLEEVVDGVVDEVVDVAIDVVSELDVDCLETAVESVADACSGAGAAVEEILESSFDPVIDAVSGTKIGEIAEEMSKNAHNFYHVAVSHLDDVQDALDSDDDGHADIKGVVHVLATAINFPESAFEIGD